MAVPQRGHKGAAKPTPLFGGISSTDLAFSVATGGGTGYPDGSDGVFVILVDGVLSGAEKILCSARTGDAFTVAPGGRGYDDTVASAHLNNASVAHTNSAIEAAEANAHILATTGVHGIADTSALLTTTAGNAAYPKVSGVAGSLAGTPPAAGASNRVQAGSSVVTLDGSGNATITFPTAFSAGVTSVVVSNGDGVSVTNGVISTVATTVTTFSINVRNGATGAVITGSFRCNWFAVGG